MQANKYNGVLIINKEAGYTSHDVVAVLRRLTRQRKIGHTGTLDPDATGVLPVCLGTATKLCATLTDHDKEYSATMLLGTVTDTQDFSGTVIEKIEVPEYDPDTLKRIILSFQGEYDQIPPMYSAIKKDGKKLYELAREGVIVKRLPRRVHIHKIDILEIDVPRVTIKVNCSKGTYIRTLCHDIGASLGCGACMENLKRTRVGCFSIEDSCLLSDIAEAADSETIDSFLIPTDQVLSEYEKGFVTREGEKPALNGNRILRDQVLLPEDPSGGRIYRIYDRKEQFIGLFLYDDSGCYFKTYKMFR